MVFRVEKLWAASGPAEQLMMLRKFLSIFTGVFVLFAGTRFLLDKNTMRPTPMIDIGGLTMGGTWSVKLPALPPSIKSAAQLEASIAFLLHRLDAEMSSYQPEGDLCKFNRDRTIDWHEVPAELAEVVAKALQVSEESGGAFDVTVAPLVSLWGFGPDSHGKPLEKIPSDLEIKSALVHVGYRRLQCRLSPPALRKSDPEVSIDLGGIGKGFAADQVSVYLNSIGADHYLIAVGGELRAKGTSAAGLPWRVGIETPTADTRRIFQQVDLHEASLSTSGNYRNFYTLGEQSFCHEIDPQTGRPVVHALASVSVIHSSGTYADAMATALIVLGPERGFQLAQKMDLAVLFIIRGEDHFETRWTDRFEALAGQRSNRR